MPLQNLVAVDDDDGAGLLSRISVPDSDGPFSAGNGVVVVYGSGFGADFGTYTLDVNGAVQGFVVVVNPAPGAFGTAANGFSFMLAEAKFGAMDRIAAESLGARRSAASMMAMNPNLTAHKPVVTNGGILANNVHIWGDVGYLAGDVDFGDSASVAYTQFGLDFAIDPDMVVGTAIGGAFLEGGDNGFDVDGHAYWVQPYLGFDFGFVRGTMSGTYSFTDYNDNTFFGNVAGAESHGGAAHLFVAHDVGMGGGLTISPYAEATAGHERFKNFTGVLAGTPDTTVLYVDSALGLEARQEFSFAPGGTFSRAAAFARAEGEYRYADHNFVTTATDDYSGISAGVALGASATMGDSVTFMVEGKADGLGGDFESYGGNLSVSIGF